MSNILDLLRPAPAIDIIQNEEQVKRKYRYWRIRLFFSIYVGYAFYYFTRKSFTFAMPALSQNLGFSKGDLGFLATVLAVTYGFSKFISGLIGDRSNARFFMALGLIATGIFNCMFGFSSNMALFAIFWGLNGWFQGWGWPAVARTMTHWFSKSERGTWWGVWSTAQNVGGAVIPLVATLAVQYFGWRYALFIPGGLCIAMGFCLMWGMRDTPQSVGLPAIEQFKNDYPFNMRHHSKGTHERELTVKEILFSYILNNKFIWFLAISYFFVYVVRSGVNDWTVLYLCEEKGYEQSWAGSCVSWFEVGGFFGILLTGWASDYFFKGRRAPLNISFAFSVAFPIIAFRYFGGMSVAVDSALMCLIGFFIFGPQMLIGLNAAELAHKKAAATATGFVGCAAYLGAAVAGYPLGKITQDFGWDGFFVAIFGSAMLATFCLLPTVASKQNMPEKTVA